MHRSLKSRPGILTFASVLQGVITVGLLLAVNVSITDSLPTPRSSNESLCSGSQERPASTRPIIIRDTSCVDHHGNPYIESIPHPTNCSLFFKCTFSDNPELPISIPQVQECVPNTYFDMDTCNCQYRVDTCCFNPNIPDHEEHRLKCACPLKRNYEGNLVADDEDDRCAGAGTEVNDP